MATTKAKQATAADERGVAKEHARLADVKDRAEARAESEAAPKKEVHLAAGELPEHTIPVSHIASKADVTVLVPKNIGQYGVVHPGGSQILHDVSPRDEGGGSIQVHPDHLQRVLFSIEGSKMLKPAELTPEQRAAEDARPVGRRPGPPLSAEEVAASAAPAAAEGESRAAAEKARKATAKTKKA